VSDVLLAGLAWTLCRWTGRDRVLIDLEGHGRDDLFDDVDLSRTVGWFTSVFPVVLEAPACDTPDTPDWKAVVRSVRRKVRAVPGNGVSHDALRYLRPELGDGVRPEVVFNYHGNVNSVMATDSSSLYAAFHEPVGQEQDPGEHSAHLLEIVGAERGGRLTFDWYYSAAVHDRATIERIVEDFHHALRAVAARCDGTV
jgi:non-ribosomal peptide synthase protein (TIGR01720 family)